jgi:hypothetical protein
MCACVRWGLGSAHAALMSCSASGGVSTQKPKTHLSTTLVEVAYSVRVFPPSSESPSCFPRDQLSSSQKRIVDSLHKEDYGVEKY